jgi:hypothetical protein
VSQRLATTAIEGPLDYLKEKQLATFKDPIRWSKNPADMQIGKSYISATEDITLPHSYPWHPRLSEKLGLFRLEQCAASHEICFTYPELLAEKVLLAGRDKPQGGIFFNPSWPKSVRSSRSSKRIGASILG